MRTGGGGFPPKTVYDLCTTGIFSDIRAGKPLFVGDIQFHQKFLTSRHFVSRDDYYFRKIIIINLSVHALMVLAIFVS